MTPPRSRIDPMNKGPDFFGNGSALATAPLVNSTLTPSSLRLQFAGPHEQGESFSPCSVDLRFAQEYLHQHIGIDRGSCPHPEEI
jgi:hypothetical protein